MRKQTNPVYWLAALPPATLKVECKVHAMYVSFNGSARNDSYSSSAYQAQLLQNEQHQHGVNHDKCHGT
ncbi:MAG: hypothetical protein QGG54_11920, partial [Gammaproteobacteria bacterium]|nr:hypothetical protein [Gammaproteobacteria bacterium]